MVPRPVPECPPGALIPEFYAGRSVFITGATGFMGKVLVERLLWTCRDIGRLYLLMRRKKEDVPEKRLIQLKQSQVFEVVRQHCPHQLEKLSVLSGDVTLPHLGMDTETINRLKDVSVVFHSAATLKFDEPLGLAVEQNVRSAIKLMDICDQLPNVQVFIHVSTAYSNAELQKVEERVYPMTTTCQQLLSVVDGVPKDIIAEITPRLIKPKPNTYTFTKAMAESVVTQRASTARYSVAIFRPSIVVSSLRNPFPGWIENLNGPSGVIVGVGKGLLHVLSCDGNAKADMIPVDIAIDTLIAVAWETAVEKSNEARVYNCCSYGNSSTWGEFERRMISGVRIHPFDSPLWYPYGFTTQSRFLQNVAETVLQTLPMNAVDYIFKPAGARMSMSTASRRLHAMNEALKFFSMREWHFVTENVRRLHKKLSPADAEIFNLDTQTIDWVDHCNDFVRGTRKYLLRERDQDMQTAQRRMFKLSILHKALLFGFAMVLCRMALRAFPGIWRAVAVFRKRRTMRLLNT